MATRRATGFVFHSIDGERYWDESTDYAFTLDEIERLIEGPTGRDRCDVSRTGRRAWSPTGTMLRLLKIPESTWGFIAESWNSDEPRLYGRLDLRFDGLGPAKLLEFNADTPTSIFEAAVFQWTWLEQVIERQIFPVARRPVQFHPRTPDRGMAEIAEGTPLASERHDR